MQSPRFGPDGLTIFCSSSSSSSRGGSGSSPVCSRNSSDTSAPRSNAAARMSSTGQRIKLSRGRSVKSSSAGIGMWQVAVESLLRKLVPAAAAAAAAGKGSRKKMRLSLINIAAAGFEASPVSRHSMLAASGSLKQMFAQGQANKKQQKQQQQHQQKKQSRRAPQSSDIDPREPLVGLPQIGAPCVSAPASTTNAPTPSPRVQVLLPGRPEDIDPAVVACLPADIQREIRRAMAAAATAGALKPRSSKAGSGHIYSAPRRRRERHTKKRRRVRPGIRGFFSPAL